MEHSQNGQKSCEMLSQQSNSTCLLSGVDWELMTPVGVQCKTKYVSYYLVLIGLWIAVQTMSENLFVSMSTVQGFILKPQTKEVL